MGRAVGHLSSASGDGVNGGLVDERSGGGNNVGRNRGGISRAVGDGVSAVGDGDNVGDVVSGDGWGSLVVVGQDRGGHDGGGDSETHLEGC